MGVLDSTKVRIDGASWLTEITVALLGLAIAIPCLMALPSDVLSPQSSNFFFVIGAIGIWRYSWWLVHLFRAGWYKRKVFPQMRSQADASQHLPSKLYVLCTSYRIQPKINFAVYDALIREAVDYGVPTIIFASISDRCDVEVIRHALDANGRPQLVEVRYLFQKGDGKRSAMADVLKAISRDLPPPDALLVSMDGDIRLEPGTFRRSLSFFGENPDLGAITTNNRAVVTGNDVTREWYDLRYAQRDLMMCSQSVSKRLTVLTGRYSAFRLHLAICPDFIAAIEHDHITHWRFGTFKFLSGDDKSSWFHLLKNGWDMTYIPDVFVTGFEELPDRRRFVFSSVDLMKRWFGNMLRTSGRAIQLGPSKMGIFTWWSLVDQRLSMWTTLTGPIVAVLITVFQDPRFLCAYLLWIMFTRMIVSLVLSKLRGRMSLLWVPLLYYNQVVGGMVKTFVSFQFNRQSWSRQGISAGEPDDPKAAARQRRMGVLMYGTSFSAMLFALMLFTGVILPADSLSIFIFVNTGSH